MCASTGSVAPGSTTAPHRRVAVVWIDSREAIVARRADGGPAVLHLHSDVPAHHRSTGHVRHDPAIRHGGGGPQEADEPHRLAHLDRFLSTVEAGVLATDDLDIIGPGVVHEELAARLRERDRVRGTSRTISCATSPRLTDRQLVARLLERSGAARPRRLPASASRSERTEG